MKSQLTTKVIAIYSLWAMNPMTCNHPQLWSGQSNCNVVAAICVHLHLHLQVFFLIHIRYPDTDGLQYHVEMGS